MGGSFCGGVKANHSFSTSACFFLHPFTEPIKTSDLHNNKKEEHDNRTIVSLKSIFDGLIFTVLQTNLKQGCTKETFKSPVSFLNKVPVAY